MGAGATVTLGVSLAVPEPYGTLLQERRASFGDAAAHGIPTHITLLPPTEVPVGNRPAIEAHLAGVALAGRAFPVRLSGTGTFRPLSPVVFVQVVEGATACSRLQERVRAPEGPLSRELAFPYHPHVTVAHGIPEPAMDRAYEELSDFECAWTATGFALYEQGGDQVWRLKREFPFAQSPSPGPGPAPGPGTGAGAGHPSGPATAPPFEVTVPAAPCRPQHQRRSALRPPATL
ncbi:2'-5' RNA ligase family protein [Streptomyces smyrnaeus]|uniref:2'-5' RNA ligase family protein n=1 Tax=Streptomyces smyrnaeus TaxID=1387713 RepID=UPI000C189061|nr:2'-5' RNA ligase family protein [Streptomyces sp. A73]